jgi:hypothetical protein
VQVPRPALGCVGGTGLGRAVVGARRTVPAAPSRGPRSATTDGRHLGPHRLAGAVLTDGCRGAVPSRSRARAGCDGSGPVGGRDLGHRGQHGRPWVDRRPSMRALPAPRLHELTTPGACHHRCVPVRGSAETTDAGRGCTAGGPAATAYRGGTRRKGLSCCSTRCRCRCSTPCRGCGVHGSSIRGAPHTRPSGDPLPTARSICGARRRTSVGRPLATVILTRPMSASVARDVRFDPWNTGGSMRPVGLLNRVRRRCTRRASTDDRRRPMVHASTSSGSGPRRRRGHECRRHHGRCADGAGRLGARLRKPAWPRSGPMRRSGGHHAAVLVIEDVQG